MALVLKDRVKVTTTTTGTGDFAIGGAQFGFQGFSAFANGDTTYYTAVDNATGDWETGLGTYSTTGPSLARTQVLASSTGTAINFGAGSKDLFVVYPAGRAVLTDGAVLTGPLSVPADASGAQVPQAQEIGTLADAQLTTHYKRSNILGTVSQSGGVPTGAIIETGSNANGRYVRFADGTQITHTRFTYLTTSTANQSVTLPATFTSTDYNCFAQVEAIASGSNAGSFVAESVASTASAALVKVLVHEPSAINYLASDQGCKLICVGRWF